MMKNATPSHSITTSLLAACLMCVSIFIANAQQVCTPNGLYQGGELGLYPRTDVSSPIDTFICGEQGGYAHLTVAVPDSLTNPARIDMNFFRISGVNGFPSGMSFASNVTFHSPNPRNPNENPYDATFTDRSIGCMLINIPPSTTPGNYPITVTAIINGFYPVSFGNNSFQSGYYTLRVAPVGQCPNLVPFTINSCLGNSSTLVAAHNGRYRWSTGDTTNLITVSPITTTQYFLSTTLTNGSIKQDTYTVNINPGPVVSISGPSASILNCQGASITLQASGATNYVWSNTTTGSNTNFSFSNSGIQYVSVVGSTNGCSGTATLAVSITPSPVVNITASETTLCSNGPVILQASGGGTLLWDDGSTDSIVTRYVTASTLYNVTVEDSNGCSSVAGINITLAQPPVPIYGMNPTEICGSTPVTVTALNNFGSILAIPGFPMAISQPGTYSVTTTDPSNQCSVTTSFNVVQSSNCDGLFVLESDSSSNYFDTLTVKLWVRDGVDVFSGDGEITFDSTYLRFVSASNGGYLGSSANFSVTPLNSNTLSFNASKLMGQAGSDGDGLFLELKFLLDSIPLFLPFNAVNPSSMGLDFNVTNIQVFNSTSTTLTSFSNFSLTSDVTVLRYYVPVWPGDCNNDRRVDVADFIRIGAIYGTRGASRTFTGNWTAQPARLWGFDLTNPTGTAYDCFVDANGDGYIDFMDTTFVSTNLGLVHQMAAPQRNFANAQFLEEEKTLLPSISLELPDSVLQISQFPCTRTVTVTLGSTQTPVIDIYGLAFDLVFDNRFVDVNGIILDYSGSVFGNLGTNFFKMEDARDKQNGRWSVGITRLNSIPTSSRGDKILTMEVPFIANPTGNWFKMNAFPLAANDENDNAILLSAGGDSLRVQRPIGLETVIASVGFSILPNPTTGLVSLELENQYSDDLRALVYDSCGRTVFSTNIVSTSKTIDVAHLPSGVYWVKLNNGLDSFRPQKLILQK